jgi:hypothetical protein
MNFQKRIKNMSVHEPEDWLWKKIESELEEGDVEQAKLRLALANLPQHNPSAQVWNKVENVLQNADNEDFKLKDALSKLRQYEPPSLVFTDIFEELEAERFEDEKLQKALANLPVHTPPEGIFLKILQQIPAQKSAIVRSISSVRFSAAAAVFGLLFMLGLGYYLGISQSDSMRFSYRSEQVDDAVLKANQIENAEDEKAFAMVNEICQTKSYACEQPEVKNLKSTLDELNAAHAQLKEAIGAYNTDENLHLKLKNVDYERTEVLKKIMSMI